MDGLISDPVRNIILSSLVPECIRMNWVLFIFDDEDKIKYKWIVLNYEYNDTYTVWYDIFYMNQYPIDTADQSNDLCTG